MEVYAPKYLEEVKDCLQNLTEDSRVIGGGTDYIIRMKNTMQYPDKLCYFGNVLDYTKVEENRDGLEIGAYVTMTRLAEDERIKKHFPALSQAAVDVGSVQIRNRATIGGNIGNASPAGDLLPVLYLYNAMLEISSPNGVRQISIKDVIKCPGRTTLSYNEFISKIYLPYNEMSSSFVKLGMRRKVTISRIGVALGLKMDQGRIEKASIIIGAISVRPVILKKAEDYLIGKELDPSHIEQVAKFLSELILEITPKEFDRDYKIFAARGVIEDVFANLMR